VTDWKNEGVIADLRGNQSIKKIWQGDRYRRLRDLHLKKEYFNIPLCKDCADWLSSRWDFGYETAIKAILPDLQNGSKR
jgi:hypothetical protein